MRSLCGCRDSKPEIRRWDVDKQGRRYRSVVVCSTEQEEDVREIIRGVCSGYGYYRASRIFAVVLET